MQIALRPCWRHGFTCAHRPSSSPESQTSPKRVIKYLIGLDPLPKWARVSAARWPCVFCPPWPNSPLWCLLLSAWCGSLRHGLLHLGCLPPGSVWAKPFKLNSPSVGSASLSLGPGGAKKAPGITELRATAHRVS